jgi:hypothetical protein
MGELAGEDKLGTFESETTARICGQASFGESRNRRHRRHRIVQQIDPRRQDQRDCLHEHLSGGESRLLLYNISLCLENKGE